MKIEDEGVRIVDDRPAYANGCGVHVLPCEIMLMFTITDGHSEETQGTFLLSPEMAKAFSILLTAGVIEYEKKYGSIRDIQKLMNQQPGPGYAKVAKVGTPVQ